MVVLIHGWSGNKSSVSNLAKMLKESGLSDNIEQIYLGDYISLDDDVTFDDLAVAMDRAWDDKNLPRSPRSVDVVAHSTGALVIRHWISTVLKFKQIPIYRLALLAGANFGSPLAHTGRTIFGRALKGWEGTRLFETGEKLLNGLELGSDFTYNLAMRDRFSEVTPFKIGNILATSIVGNTGYDGIKAIGNRKGSDGTVRISTADMNPVHYTIDFTNLKPEPEPLPFKGDPIPLGILDDVNHEEIVLRGSKKNHNLTLNSIIGALLVTDDTYQDWSNQVSVVTTEVIKKMRLSSGDYKNEYQNTVFLVTDHMGYDIEDYTIELYKNSDDTRSDRIATRRIQENVIANVHVNKKRKAMRNFLIDCTELYPLFSSPNDRLGFSITASPQVFKGKRHVGYRTYTDKDLPSLSFGKEMVKTLFSPHRTAFIHIILKREQSDNLFNFHRV